MNEISRIHVSMQSNKSINTNERMREEKAGQDKAVRQNQQKHSNMKSR